MPRLLTLGQDGLKSKTKFVQIGFDLRFEKIKNKFLSKCIDYSLLDLTEIFFTKIIMRKLKCE